MEERQELELERESKLERESELEREPEERYLKRTIEAAEKQLAQAHEAMEKRQSELAEVKKEVQENTEHGIRDLSDTADFEALVELNQSVAPIAQMAADCDELMRKIRRLENLIRTPYFARIDFCFEGEEVPEKVYIGRTSLMEKGASEIYVYDWRSPIASVFYRFMTGEAYYDAPNGRIEGNVERKRQYEIKNSQLLYFFDTNVSISDEILKHLLSQNTSPQMKTIVETIQREQDIVIRNMENDLLMIQGVAGSGKTSIALHRAAYLMYQGLQGSLAANNILILSPNSAFEQYISNVLPELGEENAVSEVFEDLLGTLLKEKKIQPQSAFLEKAVSHSSYTGLAKRSMEFKTSERFKEILDRFVEEIPRSAIEYQDVYFRDELIVPKEELKESILRRPGVPLAERLKQLEKRVFEDISINRKDKTRGGRVEVMQELQEFTRLDVYDLYEKLWRDEDYFRRIVEGKEERREEERREEEERKEEERKEEGGLRQEEACLQGAESGDRWGEAQWGRSEACAAKAENIGEKGLHEIRRYTLENLESGCIYFDDAIAILYLYLKIYDCRDYRHIRQVIIDEAQDYYPLQYEIFRMLFPDAKYTVLGDINQTLTKRERLSFYEQVRDILKKRNSSLIALDKSFRCTNEILHFGLQVLSGGKLRDAAPSAVSKAGMPSVGMSDAEMPSAEMPSAGMPDAEMPDKCGEEQGSGIKCFNRSGDQVEMRAFDMAEEYLDGIVREVGICREKGFETICLLCKTRENCRRLLARLESRLKLQILDDDGAGKLEGNFIMPSYMAKGLEFDAVIICDADSQNYFDEDDRKILYVECTRALHRLSVFCEGEVTPLIKG